MSKKIENKITTVYYNHGVHIENDTHNYRHYRLRLKLLERIILTKDSEIKFLRKIIELTESKKLNLNH